MKKYSKIKVWIVDDHKMFVSGLAGLLNSTSDIRATGISNTGDDVLSRLNNSNIPDVFIIDIEMPDMDGCELSVKIRSKFPDVKIIAISMHSQQSYIKRMIECGVQGYLIKNESSESLFKAIRQVASGGYAFNNDEAIKLFLTRFAITGSKSSLDDKLTDQELKIISLLKIEMSTKQIADTLNYSISSIEHHKRQIMKKLGVKTSVGIVAYAIENKLI